MTRFHRAMAVFLLFIGLQLSLAGQSGACVPSGGDVPSTIAAAPSTSHDGHRGSQHHPGEHSRQHCLTSVICLQLPSPGSAMEPFSLPASGQAQIAVLTIPPSQSSQPTTPPPRA